MVKTKTKQNIKYIKKAQKMFFKTSSHKNDGWPAQVYNVHHSEEEFEDGNPRKSGWM